MIKIKTTIGSRLKQIMSERGLKQVDILRNSEPYQKKYDISLKKNNLSQYVNDKNSPEDDKIFLLAQTLGVNEAWLMGFDVDREPVVKNDLPSNVIPVAKTRRIPLLGVIPAGEPVFAEENIQEYIQFPIDLTPRGELFFLKVKGDSMEPTIPEGSLVLIRVQEMVENHEIAAVLVNDDTEATLKRIRFEDNQIYLMSDNTDYLPRLINSESPGKIIGKAVKIIADLK